MKILPMSNYQTLNQNYQKQNINFEAWKLSSSSITPNTEQELARKGYYFLDIFSKAIKIGFDVDLSTLLKGKKIVITDTESDIIAKDIIKTVEDSYEPIKKEIKLKGTLVNPPFPKKVQEIIDGAKDTTVEELLKS